MANEQHIIISGIGRGIGKAMAEIFGEDGWNVWGAARSEIDLNKLQVIWEGRKYKGQLKLFVGDLSQPSAIQSWADEIKQGTDKVHALVHNVGQFTPGRLLDSRLDSLEELLVVNALSAHHLTRAVLPLLETAPNSKMITIGTVATTDWPMPMANYALSKYLLEGWHQQMRKELHVLGIGATLIRPGATLTSSWDGVAVDPETLLSAEQIAHEVWRIINYPGRADFETITVHPQAI